MGSLEALVLSLALVSGGGGSDVVLLDFTADWCQPCKMMAPVVQRLEDQGFPVRRINVDQQPQLAQQFNVQGIPCFVLVEDGKEVDRVQGAVSYDLLVRLFERSGYRATEETTVRAQSPDGEEAAPRRWTPVSNGAATEGARASGDRSSVNATGNAVQQAALSSSVRLRVEEPNGQAFGTGTIIDVRENENEALIVTCGHLFRETQGQGKITVELLGPGGGAPVPGTLIAYDAKDRDTALVAFRPGRPVVAATIPSGVQGIEPGAPVFSVGCDHGGEPSVISSRISAVDKYVGREVYAHNIEVAGQPVDGRSGGGLFDAQGRLIGVCNAADPADNEGIYAGLKSIHWQLDQIGFSQLYQSAGADASSVAVRQNPAPAQSLNDAGQHGRDQVELASATSAPARIPNLLEALNSDAEVICIIRGRHQKDGEVLVLDQSSRELLARYAREQAESADGIEVASVPEEPATVRGQNR